MTVGNGAFGPLFANPGYVKLWSVGVLTGIMRWLEMLALGLYALDETGSPSLVALLVMLRFLPLAIFGVLVGAVSDIVSPRLLLIRGLAAVGLVSAGMLAAFLLADPGYPAVAAAAFLSGLFWATDMPIRRKMIGGLVEPGLLASGMALDGAASNGMRFIGPLMGGVLYHALGIEGIFALGAAVYAAALVVALSVEDGPALRAGAADGPGRLMRTLTGAAEALAHAWADPDARRILLVTVLFNIWAFPYLSMMPVIGREALGLSPAWTGALTAIEGLFALLAAVLVVRSRPARGLRQLYFGATVLLLAVIMAMGAFPGLWVIAIGLALGGACTAVFAAMQSTLIYAVAPPAMAGRYLGLMTISIGVGVIGFLNIGLTAEIFGAPAALWIVALEGLGPALWIGWTWRRMRSGG